MFSTSTTSVAALASFVMAAVASADLIGGWTMPCAFPTGTGNVPVGTFYRPPLAVNPDGTFNANPNLGGTTWDPALAGRADVGARALQAGWELSSTHQNTVVGSNTTSYTAPAGNGSAYAFSSNGWTLGDWYQARFDTVGYQDLTFSFDMTRSSTGPATWIIEMSVNGGAFSTLLDSYNCIQAGGTGTGTSNWSSTTGNYQAAFTTTLSLGAVANDAASVTVRIRSLVGPTGSNPGSGTARIDNIMVNGNLIPAPGAVALLGLAGIAARRRRR
jgi:hypothetical protein